MTPLVHAFPAVPGQPPDPGRALLGGKGAGLVLMTGLGLSVPPGFVITTAAARQHHAGARSPALPAAVRAEVERLARRTGRRFGGPGARLMVSVRSGAPESMPGMLDTLLDVGRGDGERAYTELFDAIGAVLRSWDGERAVTYRRLRGLDDATGTAVVVQAMVDGTADGFSGTGVLFTRDPATGAPGLTGEFLPGARGPELVDGVRTPRPLATLAADRPDLHGQLARAARRLERSLADMCEVEFTVERDRLWLLQVRPGKRTERAALRIAVDLAREGLISQAEAARRCPAPDGADGLTRIAALPDDQLLCRGLPGSPGAAVGRIALDLAATEEFTDRGDAVILVRATTQPADLPAMALAAGVLTTAGGTTSHAAVVARELGVPCVCGAAALEIDLDRRVIRVSGRELAEGAMISIDGAAAVVAAGTHDTTADPGTSHDLDLRRLLADWAATGSTPPPPDGREPVRTALLNAVVIKGVAETDAVADATDVAADEAGRILAELAEAGLIRHRSGRLTGWSPTAEGRKELTRLIRAEGLDRPSEDVYHAFVAVNADFKQLCTDWQAVRPAVNSALTDRLTAVHGRVRPVIEAFAAAQSRFAAYHRRLDAARERFLGGDPDALTGIRPDSYHSVWMELHADLLTTLDRPRTAQDGA